MPYQEDIPRPTDILSVSQNDILQNFTTIDTAWNINHVPFDVADQGKHNKVHLPNQDAIVPIDPVTTGTETALYSKTSTLTTVTELFVMPRNSGTEIPITAKLGAATGWAYLPNGLLIKWGEVTATGDDTFTLAAGATIPDFAAIYSIQLTVTNPGITDIDHAIRAISYTVPSTIRVYASSRSTVTDATVTFDYFIIGS